MDLLYPSPATNASGVFSDPVRPRLCVYVDDLLAHDQTFPEHLANLRQVFERLESTGLSAKPSKCSLALPEQPFLGFVVDAETRKPDPEKVQAIRDFPDPLTRTAVQRFLGMVGYYRDFVEGFAKRTAHLRKMTLDTHPHRWSALPAEAKAEMEWLKEEMASDRVVLQHPDWDAPFIVQTDACADGLGAVLAQRVVSPVTGKLVERPVRYASRAIQTPESKWTTREQELLGVIWACEKWHNYLWGREFQIQTDHANLKWLETSAPTKGRLSRWACRLGEFNYTLSHKPGKDNQPPDALS